MILVCGEALIDLTPDGPGEDARYQPCPGGGPFNTAVALGRLGVPAGFFGRLSSDPFGEVLAHRLRDAGVDGRWALQGDQPTPLAVVTLGGAGRENRFQFYMAGTAAPAVTVADLPASLDGVGALHVGTLGLVLEPMATSIELLVTRAAADRVVGFDPNVRPLLVGDREAFAARVDRIARLSDVVKVSDADAAWLTGGAPAEDLVARWMGEGAGLVVVTRGAAGATAWTPAAGPVTVPAPAVAVVDTVGAGDSFNAGLLAWLHDHGRLTKAAVRSLTDDDVAAALGFAQAVSAITCSRAGADPPWRHELGG